MHVSGAIKQFGAIDSAIRSIQAALAQSGRKTKDVGLQLISYIEIMKHCGQSTEIEIPGEHFNFYSISRKF